MKRRHLVCVCIDARRQGWGGRAGEDAGGRPPTPLPGTAFHEGLERTRLPRGFPCSFYFNSQLVPREEIADVAGTLEAPFYSENGISAYKWPTF